MGDAHQDKWLDALPFVLLGRRVAYQPDIGASASEMTFGKRISIPGELLQEPDSSNVQSLQSLLEIVRRKTDVAAKQPSRHIVPERPLPAIPLDVNQAYTRQHHKVGLQPNYEGPFNVTRCPIQSGN